jgi:hypothetical protein
MRLLSVFLSLALSTSVTNEHERRGARVLLHAGTVDITDAMMRSGSSARHATTLYHGERIELRGPAIDRDRTGLSLGAASWDVEMVKLEQWLVHVKSPVTPKTEEGINAVIAPYRLGSYVPHNTVSKTRQAPHLHHTLAWTPFNTPSPLQFLLVAPKAVAARARRSDPVCLPLCIFHTTLGTRQLTLSQQHSSSTLSPAPTLSRSSHPHTLLLHAQCFVGALRAALP